MDTIFRKFRQKNIVIDGVKGFLQIQENDRVYITLVNVVSPAISSFK